MLVSFTSHFAYDMYNMHCRFSLFSLQIVPCEVWQQTLSRRLDYGMCTMSQGYKCSTPDCDAWVEVLEGSAFICPSCKANNCIKCKVVHTGHCVEDELLDEFKEVVKLFSIKIKMLS